MNSLCKYLFERGEGEESTEELGGVRCLLFALDALSDFLRRGDVNDAADLLCKDSTAAVARSAVAVAVAAALVAAIN